MYVGILRVYLSQVLDEWLSSHQRGRCASVA